MESAQINVADSPFKFQSNFNIADRRIGDGHPCFIIAEAGVSHFGSIEKAFKLVDAAVNAGADAVKFQHFKTTNMISSENTEWVERMKSKELPIEAYAKIQEYCREKGILFFSTAHDIPSLEEIMSLNVPCYKVGSGELQNPEYYELVGKTGKPVIASTGMFLEEDVIRTMKALSESGCQQAALLHCITVYPTPPEDVNLRMISTLKSMFSGPVGYSDHSATHDVAAASVLLGAQIIEKHITLEKNIPNAQDWKVSCTPDELVEFVASIRRLEAALGDGNFKLAEGEVKSREWARKSIVINRDLNRGDVIKREDLIFKRPGTGISPQDVESILGKTCIQNIKADSILTEGMIN